MAEFKVLWRRAVSEQAHATGLTRAKAGSPEHQERLEHLAAVDSVVLEILEDHIDKVQLKLETRKGGRWQLLHLIYDDTLLKIPLPKLDEELQKKVRYRMNKVFDVHELWSLPVHVINMQKAWLRFEETEDLRVVDIRSLSAYIRVPIAKSDLEEGRLVTAYVAGAKALDSQIQPVTVEVKWSASYWKDEIYGGWYATIPIGSGEAGTGLLQEVTELKDRFVDGKLSLTEDEVRAYFWRQIFDGWNTIMRVVTLDHENLDKYVPMLSEAPKVDFVHEGQYRVVQMPDLNLNVQIHTTNPMAGRVETAFRYGAEEGTRKSFSTKQEEIAYWRLHCKGWELLIERFAYEMRNN